ncbi:MAG TPA: coproporphyrinogen-III oxidase family protein [Thermoanaerobaculia bacterium]|nr:coproporphyrinogen-III oxidase family protein [Thermoanaerobaculia bacterium]
MRIEPTRKGFLSSYPLHRHWRPESIGGVLEPKPLNVYLHSPYCIQRCAYCYFKTATIGETRRDEVDRYVGALCREVELAARHFNLGSRPVRTVYFGGGTPTLLSEANLKRLMRTLRENLAFDDPEIVMEAEPVTLTPAKAETLKELGVNRISLGIQSFRDEIVLRTGRHDKEVQALAAIEIAKSTGAVVNVDLLSGLAGETHETWAYSVERAIEAGLHAVTVYKMELYANTEYYSGVRQHTLDLPSDEMEVELMSYAMDRLEGAGYLPVNFFTHTREGKYAQQHITNRWRGEDLFSLGVSAFGSFGSWSYQNTSDLGEYQSQLEGGALPVLRGYTLSGLDLMVRDIVLGMKLLSLDLKELRRRHGVDLKRLCAPALEELERQELIRIEDATLLLTRKGRLYGDTVGKALGASLQQLMTGEAPA